MSKTVLKGTDFVSAGSLATETPEMPAIWQVQASPAYQEILDFFDRYPGHYCYVEWETNPFWGERHAIAVVKSKETLEVIAREKFAFYFHGGEIEMV